MAVRKFKDFKDFEDRGIKGSCVQRAKGDWMGHLFVDDTERYSASSQRDLRQAFILVVDAYLNCLKNKGSKEIKIQRWVDPNDDWPEQKHVADNEESFNRPTCKTAKLSGPEYRLRAMSAILANILQEDAFSAAHPTTGEPVKKESLLNTAPKNNSKEGKARASLLPMDVLMEFLVPAYEEGCLKYDRESWRKGFQTSVLIDATQRHIGDFFYLREDWDPDAAKLGVKKHHLAGAIVSLLSILWSLKMRPELDDRPKILVGEK